MNILLILVKQHTCTYMYIVHTHLVSVKNLYTHICIYFGYRILPSIQQCTDTHLHVQGHNIPHCTYKILKLYSNHYCIAGNSRGVQFSCSSWLIIEPQELDPQNKHICICIIFNYIGRWRASAKFELQSIRTLPIHEN